MPFAIEALHDYDAFFVVSGQTTSKKASLGQLLNVAQADLAQIVVAGLPSQQRIGQIVGVSENIRRVTKLGVYQNYGSITLSLAGGGRIRFEIALAYFETGSIWDKFVGGVKVVGTAGSFVFAASVAETASRAITFEHQLANTQCATDARTSMVSRHHYEAAIFGLRDIRLPHSEAEAIEMGRAGPSLETCVVQSGARGVDDARPIHRDGIWGPETYREIEDIRRSLEGTDKSDDAVLREITRRMRSEWGLLGNAVEAIARYREDHKND